MSWLHIICTIRSQINGITTDEGLFAVDGILKQDFIVQGNIDDFNPDPFFTNNVSIPDDFYQYSAEMYLMPMDQTYGGGKSVLQFAQ